MKNFNFFSSLFAFVIFCFATTISNAQVNANSNFYTTGNPYTYAATAGSGSTAVVALIKPTTNQIRVSSYFVSTTGAVTWKSNYDFSSASIVKVAMLTDNRVVVARAGAKLRLTTIDINASTGALTKKNDYEAMTLNSSSISIVKLSSNSFATLVRHSDGNQLRTFTVDANGVITMKGYLTFNGSDEVFDLIRLSNTRVVAAVKVSESYVKFICFNIASGTLAVTEGGNLGWNNAVSKLSLASFSNERFAVFAIDANNRLDAMSLNVNAAGTVTLVDAKLDIKKPGTSNYLQLTDIAAQTISTAPGKILLSTAQTNNNLAVVPFSLTNGLIAAQSGGYFPNAPNVSQVSAGFITGNMMIGASRKIEDGKYHIGCYKWN